MVGKKLHSAAHEPLQESFQEEDLLKQQTERKLEQDKSLFGFDAEKEGFFFL